MTTTERVALNPNNPAHTLPEGFRLYVTEIGSFFYDSDKCGGIASDDYDSIEIACEKSWEQHRFLRTLRAKLKVN